MLATLVNNRTIVLPQLVSMTFAKSQSAKSQSEVGPVFLLPRLTSTLLFFATVSLFQLDILIHPIHILLLNVNQRPITVRSTLLSMEHLI